MKIPVFSNVLFCGALCGAQLSQWLTVGVAKRDFAAEPYVLLHQSQFAAVTPLMMPLGLLAILSFVPFLVARARLAPAARWTSLAGFIALFAALIISVAGVGPVDAAIAGWTLETIPVDWSGYRDRWDQLHASRTCAGVIAFALACACAATLTRIEPSRRTTGMAA